MDTQQTYTFASSPDQHQLGTSQLGMRLPHHRIARVMWGSAALMGLVLLAGLTAQLGGCMLSGPTVINLTRGGTGGGTQGEDTGSSVDGGTTDGSGTTFVPEIGSSEGSSSSSGSTGSSEPICAVEGLECICDGTRSDPFDCVDECLWVDAPPDCMCDGMTSPPEWCDVAPCEFLEDGTCLCAGLPAPVTWCD